MLDLSPIVTRLRAQCGSFKDVDFALNAQASTDDIKRMPALYLLQGTWKAGPQRASTGMHIQNVTTSFDLIYFVNATGANTASGKRASQTTDQLAALQTEVTAAIVGWTWSEFVNPIRAVSGQLSELDANRLIFTERFETDAELRIVT